ncbi:uncharacterized protein LOC128230038 [Mya arenaria]|uniref:uncharacterized protein LOC128230038 n=1 Tax=Mya arenaria TaxID=6604 RepID=UPI0022E797C1|nr:uncharacterized protein LOC128230038 [Mya arenaria]
MAWRTKTLLLVCFLLTVSFLIVQDNISLVVDTKNRGPNAPAAASTYFTLSKHVPEPPDVIQNESKAAVSRFVQLPPDTHRNNLTTVVGNTANDGGNVEGGAFVSQAIPVPTVVLSPADQETEHGLRISHLKTACAASEEERLVETKKANLTEFFYSQSHDFAYCKVPKSGSTFWMKVFMMLTKGNDVYESLQNMSRGDIHAKTRPLRVNPARLLRKKVPTVVVSRNPFTRLFSAFVDKVYLPLFWEHFAVMEGTKRLPPKHITTTKEFLKTSRNGPISPRLIKHMDRLRLQGMIVKRNVTLKISPICANNATFEDFLKFIIGQVKLNKHLESHWAPISHLCRPCKLNTFKIVKQESFSPDVEHTLNSVGINLTDIDWLHRSLYENRVENSIPGIVAVLESRLHNIQTKMCMSDQEAAARLWKSFQIQGYISDILEVPVAFKSAKFKFSKEVVTIEVLSAIKKKPLSNVLSKQQRRKHLKEAYRGVSETTLTAIRNIYTLDFILFGYSFELPN